MIRVLAFTAVVLVACFSAFEIKAAEHAIRLSEKLSADDIDCLSRLLPLHFKYPGDHGEDISELMRTAKVGHAPLSPRKDKAYIFLFDNSGWCGSAGCMLMVGERRHGGSCELIYESDGFAQAIAISDKGDHGYRRLYTPCEARFDGRRYSQVREECPTIDVQR